MINLIKRALSPQMLQRNLRIAAVVGSILNVINQWNALIGEAAVSWPHVALNYLVPFLVASYSAAASKKQACRDRE